MLGEDRGVGKEEAAGLEHWWLMCAIGEGGDNLQFGGDTVGGNTWGQPLAWEPAADLSSPRSKYLEI